MRKTFLKKLLVLSSTAMLLVYGAIYACGGGDWDWDYVFQSNFTPETFTDKKFAPLFLSQGLFYGGFSMENNAATFDKEIVSDWSEYLKGKMATEEVKFFLLDSSAADVEGLSKWYSSKKDNMFSQKWTKKVNLKDQKIKDFMMFLSYAKQIESASVTKDYWSYDPVQYKTITDQTLPAKLEVIYKNTSNIFLKNRYWFQVIKAHFYSANKQNAIPFFESTERTVPKNGLYYRAVSYLAGIHYKAKNYAKANYLYSRVFDKCPELRYVAVFCFHPQEESDWNQSLAMAKSNPEKAALWAIQGYYGDEEKAIAAIFGLDPQSEYLDFLLTRLINNQELAANQSFTDRTSEYRQNSERISKSALELVIRIAQSEKTAKPYLWNTAAGYLETLHNNCTNADTYFDKAEKQMPKSGLAQNQLRLLRFVNSLSKVKTITPKTEQELLPDLQWLYEILPTKEMVDFRYQYASDWSKNYLSNLYKEKGNKVMAEVFIRNPNFYEEDANLEMMKTFLSKENKTPFEQTALKVYNVSLDDINEYQAVNAAFENKIPEAIAFMKNTAKQSAQLLGNPFNGNIKDCHDCDHAAYQKTKYSNLDYLVVINDMQNKLIKKEAIYTNNLLLGNAFYNMTHFGNARVFHEGNIFGYGVTPYDFRDSSKSRITNCAIAKSYYQNALAAAKTDEQRAKCHYMLAKCERNEYYNEKYDRIEKIWNIYNETTNFYAWNDFIVLKKKYSKTKFYQEVIAECGYFDTYVNGKK